MASTISRIIDLVNLVYINVVWWFILKKSGEKGWKTLIPIYGVYCRCKSIDSLPLFWGGIALVIVHIILSWAIRRDPYPGNRALSFIELIIILYLHVRFSMNTAKAFNKSGGFTAGLIFLPHIFLGILAFGKSKHKNQIEDAEEANFQDQI